MLLVGVVTLLFSSACVGGEDADAPSDPADPKGSDRVVSRRLPCEGIDRMIERARRGWVPIRAHDIALLPREPNYIGSAAKPVHTGPWDFLAEVPLLFYGPGVVERARIDRAVTLADVAPSIAEMIGFDFDAPDGRSIVSEHLTGRKPELVVTIVWDGGGWNALREHSNRWPVLRHIMERGLAFTGAEIGSTPSNTPPIHTTIGTGAFPRTHGIPAVKMTLADGSYVDPYEGHDADAVKVPTLADLYDVATENRAVVGLVATVNWHLGMIGHGLNHPGADADLALLMNDRGESYGNPSVYRVPPATGGSLPDEAGTLDAVDGARDGRWIGHDLTDVATRYASPAYVSYQQRVIESFIRTHGMGRDGVADLLYTNLKSIDDAGHRWGMTSRETGEVIAASDRALRRLVSFLDREVGEGRWVIALTADHGQTLYPNESGGWPIGGAELRGDANDALDRNDDGKDLVTRITSAGAFVAEDQLAPNDLTMKEVGRWFVGYTASENLKEGAKLPTSWRERKDERLFDAAVIRDDTAILGCRR